LRQLAELCGNDWEGGIVLYAGNHAVRLAGNNMAIPLAWLWER
jgi:hypothetical protein